MTFGSWVNHDGKRAKSNQQATGSEEINEV